MMKKICTFLLALATIPATTTVIEARLIVRETTKYYEVSGKTGHEIHSQFGKNGPEEMRRKHAIATTVRTFDFKNIKFVERGKRCVISHVEVHLNLTYRYPKWVNVNLASKNTRRVWAKYSKALIRHEQTHGKYFKATARKFERELLKTTGRLSRGCKRMSAVARARIKKVYRLGEAKHEAFDRRESRAIARIQKLERELLNIR